MTPPPELQLNLFLIYFSTVMFLVCDLKWKSVPNWLTWPLVAIGCGTAYAYGGWAGQGDGFVALADIRHPNLLQSLVALMSVGILFGWSTWKGAFGKVEFQLLLVLASLSPLRAFLNFLMIFILCVALWALVVVIAKGQIFRLFAGFARRLTLRGRLRDDNGQLDPIHRLTIPVTPSIALGVFLSAAGWGWSL